MHEASTQLFDTGDIFDYGLAGGRVGVFTFSQVRSIWSQLKYVCREEWTGNLASITCDNQIYERL